MTTIRFSLSETDLAKVQQAADRLGLSTGELFRSFVSDLLTQPEKEVDERVTKVRRKKPESTPNGS